MTEQKTKPNDKSVEFFLDKISDETRRTQSYSNLYLIRTTYKSA
jgi:hypothetical protein